MERGPLGGAGGSRGEGGAVPPWIRTHAGLSALGRRSRLPISALEGLGVGPAASHRLGAWGPE